MKVAAPKGEGRFLSTKGTKNTKLRFRAFGVFRGQKKSLGCSRWEQEQEFLICGSFR
jgi:hypothetical protein